MMKRTLLITTIVLSLISCIQESQKNPGSQPLSQFIDSTEMTNNFYDNSETFALPVSELFIDGEISNPGKVDFSTLNKHSVIVKETLLDSAGKDRFTGAFRYDGYSLFDILEKSIIKKANTEEFSPIIDLFVEIENDNGEKVVFSWGEIYYPNNLHKILISSGVSRIVPSKTKELWTLPGSSGIIAANDPITERNISNPMKITVKSWPGSFKMEKGLTPMHSEEIKVYNGENEIGKIASIPESVNEVTFNTIFYGRGRGIHSTTPFTGYMLKDILLEYYPVTKENLRTGMLCISAKDGYRCSLSYSELFNRNDQQELLLVKTVPQEDGGLFRMFPACDFFSDRAIKSVSEIHMGY
jgi:hypothetical protein